MKGNLGTALTGLRLVSKSTNTNTWNKQPTINKSQRDREQVPTNLRTSLTPCNSLSRVGVWHRVQRLGEK